MDAQTKETARAGAASKDKEPDDGGLKEHDTADTTDRLVAAYQTGRQDAENEAAEGAQREEWRKETGTRLALTRRLSDVEPKAVDWMWPERFARGKVSLIAGNPGLGKSQITASMAAIVTTGGRWPVDRTSCDIGSVLILSAEDDAADTIVPRLKASGADLARIHQFEAVRDYSKETVRDRTVSLLDDIEQLDEAAARIGDVSLIVIDPVTAFLGAGRIDSHNNTDIRSVMMDLQQLAERRHAAVIGVSHLSKGRQQQALMAVMGSLGWVAAARAAYGVFRDEDGDGSRRLMLPLKNNIGDDKAGFAFSIEPTEIEGGIATSRISWESDPVTQSADEIYSPDEGGKSATDEAVEFLRDVLESGPMGAKDVKREARDAGITDKPLRLARKRLDIQPRKTRFDGGWEWALPEDAPDAQEAHSRERAPSGSEGTLGHEDALDAEDAPPERGGAFGSEGTFDPLHRHRTHIDRALAGTPVTVDQLRAQLSDDDLADFEADNPPPIEALRAIAERIQQECGNAHENRS